MCSPHHRLGIRDMFWFTVLERMILTNQSVVIRKQKGKQKRIGESETVSYNSVGKNSVPVKIRLINTLARKQNSYWAYMGFLLKVSCVRKIDCFFNFFSCPNIKYSLSNGFL